MLFYISLLLFVMLLVFDMKKVLHMAQQNLYNDDNRFLKWTLKKFKCMNKSDKVLLIFLLSLILISFISIFSNTIISVYFAIMILIILSLKIKESKNNDVKLKLKITARVKRLIVTNLILFVLLLFISNYVKNIGIKYALLVLYDILLNFVVILSIIINKPVEKLVFLSFKRKAVNKLKSMPNLKVIGITGSYGKTSSKNILNDILSLKYNTLPSPKNFNTPYGLIITANNYLDKFDEVLIAEMGAYKKGEIKELCDLVKPKYGILTKIGTAHIEIFGSQENIQSGKFELIESLPHDGIGILNRDDELQVNYKLKNDCKIVWVGIESEDADVRACNIKTSNKGTSFDVIFKGNKEKYSFTTKLLGYNNIYNILSSLALANEFGLTKEQMQKAVQKVNSVEHRLELRNAGNITYIDDSYNSNPVGSKMALEVLKDMPGKRVIITPGMVELGDKSYELNKAFGTYMKGCTDYVILVGEKITKPIKDGLDETKFNKDNIFIVKSVNEGFKKVKELALNEQIYCLIENDLPDIYNE